MIGKKKDGSGYDVRCISGYNYARGVYSLEGRAEVELIQPMDPGFGCE